MTTNIEAPWLALVTRADPDFQREKRREAEYEFSNGREFLADPMKRGAYAHPFLAFQPSAFQADTLQQR